MTDIPYWRSHKTVQAAKITGVQFGVFPGLVLTGSVFRPVSPDVFTRLCRMVSPKTGESENWTGLVGGYYLRYADGYESWSPAKAFEEGYTLLGGAAPGLGSSHMKVEGARFCPACGVPVNEMDRQPCMVPA